MPVDFARQLFLDTSLCVHCVDASLCERHAPPGRVHRRSLRTVVDWRLLSAKLPAGRDATSTEARQRLFSRMDANANGCLSLAEVDKGGAGRQYGADVDATLAYAARTWRVLMAMLPASRDEEATSRRRTWFSRPPICPRRPRCASSPATSHITPGSPNMLRVPSPRALRSH